MAWSISDLYPSWGDSGERPPSNFQYDGGDQVNEKHFDYLWNNLSVFENEVRDALSDIDSDQDGIVDEADYANDADASTYKGNDLDTDGDGVVDQADYAADADASAYKGNDIDSDGDGVVDQADLATDANQYDSTSPSDGSSGQYLQTDGTTTTWADVDPGNWDGNGDLLTPEGPEYGIDVETIQNSDYKENHVYRESWADITTASLNQTFDLSGESTQPAAITFNNDGTKMFVSDFYNNNNVHSYTLSTAYDVSTASYHQTLDVGTNLLFPYGMAWNGDGTKLFLSNGSNREIHSYTLSTAYDISTATHNQVLDVSGNNADAYGISWNPDGTKLFVIDGYGGIVSYTLSTAYDLSTASFHHNESINGTIGEPFGMAWSSDGKKVYVLDSNDDGLASFVLSSAYDLSTLSPHQTLDVTGDDSDMNGMAFGATGTKMYLIGGNNKNVYEYDVDHVYRADLSASNVHKVVLQAPTDIAFEGVDEARANSVTLRLQQDSDGGHSPSFQSIRWPGGSEPSWSTSANALDIVSFAYDPHDDMWDGFFAGADFAQPSATTT